MATMLKQSAVVAVVGKIIATTKDSTSESLKYEGNVKHFFDWKDIVYHAFVPHGETVSKVLYLKLMKRLGKLCEGRGLTRGQTRPECCNMTMHLLTRRFLPVNFW